MLTSSLNGSSLSDANSDISNFEIKYYMNWRHHYHELLHHLVTAHVLLEAPPLPKVSQFSLLECWRVDSLECFRWKVWVNLEMFDGLLALIVNNDIFSNNSNCPQLPIHIQLAIFLFCAGHYGNTVSPEDAAQLASISVGGVEKCTNRVIVSLLSLHDEGHEAIHFPCISKKTKTLYGPFMDLPGLNVSHVRY